MHLPVLRSCALLVFVVLATSLDGFAQHSNTTTDSQITQGIRALSRAYDDAVNNNDAVALAALFTEDAVLVSDRGPIHGRKAIENWYSGVFQVWHPRNQIGSQMEMIRMLPVSRRDAWESGKWSKAAKATGSAHPTEVIG